jgi:membrane fusion protein (multidrug efflux system)
VLGACSGDGKNDAKKKAASRPPEAGFVVVQTESVPLLVELAGRTSPFEVSEVRPQVSGIVRERLFAEGALVRAGQTLYRIEPSVYRAAESEARANLASAEATREAAQVRAQRLKPLADMEAVSRQDYTDAAAKAREAEAGVAQIRAQLEAAAINVRNTNVPAPISGRIGRSLVTTGALVTANQAEALTTIQRLDPIFVDIQQSSADLLALRRSLASGNVVPSSAPVRLRLEDGSEYSETGTLQFTEAVVDPSTGSVILRARFPNPSNFLLPGMYVRAQLSQATVREAILIPQQAVSRDPRGNAGVMVISDENKALAREIVADRTVGDKWLVTKGLAPGERVITEGLNRIRVNQPVTPVAAGSQPTQAAAGTGNAKADAKADGKAR